MALPLILDTDIGTDVDDALALAFALRNPGIDLRAVTTVSGDTRRRARLAAALLALAGRSDVEVPAGLAVDPPEGRAVEGGHEDDDLRLVEAAAGSAPAPSPRTAVEVLVGEAARGAAAGAPVTVAAVGMQTNVAAAVDADARFAGSLARLAAMGGAFPSGGFDPADEHNLSADAAGAVRALGAGAPLLVVPTDVTVRTYLLESHVDRLRRGDPMCRALAGLVDGWAPVLRRARPTPARRAGRRVARPADRRLSRGAGLRDGRAPAGACGGRGRPGDHDRGSGRRPGRRRRHRCGRRRLRGPLARRRHRLSAAARR